ncbi:MAG: lysylphosphatidylglycerol synthase transmembrane domain-containing protein [Pseudomonadota bacterium]
MKLISGKIFFKQHYKIIINSSLAVLGFFLIVLMIRLAGISPKMVINNLRNIKYYYLIAIVITNFFILSISGLKWKMILNNLVDISKIPKGYFLYNCAIAMILNTIIPQSGNYGLKTISMKLLHKIPADKGVLAIFIEQLFDLLILILLVIPSLLFFVDILSLEASVTFIVVSILSLFGLIVYKNGMIFGLIIRVYRFLLKIVSKVFFFKRRFQNNSIMSEKLNPFSRSIAIRLFFYSCLKQLCITLRVYIIILALQINIPFYYILLGSAVVQVIIIATFIPGALGSLDVSWFGVLVLMGVNAPEAGIFVVVSRILGEASLIFVAFISYLYYIFNKELIKRAQQSQENLDERLVY